MTEVVIETQIRGEWTRHAAATASARMAAGFDPEEMRHAACKTLAEMIVDGNWPGSAIRARWNETGELGDEITLLSNDLMLDDYIIEERERVREYAEQSRYDFRNAS